MVSKNRGIFKIAQGQQILTEIPIPKLRDDYLLVKTVAVALNPTDWQTLDEKPRADTKRSLLGCDASGIVVEVGKGVTKNFKKGDRVAGFAHGGTTCIPYLVMRCTYSASQAMITTRKTVFLRNISSSRAMWPCIFRSI